MPTTDHDHHLLDLDIPIFRPIEGVFSDLNLSEILYSLEGKGEIPVKYVYFGNGVENWKIKSINQKEELATFTHANLGKEHQLVNTNLDLILGIISNKNKVNVVDIGPGTGYPVFPILSFLQEEKKLNKYIPIDIVDEMNTLAIDNLKSIDILSKMKTQKYVHDFEYGHFADLMFKERKDGAVNLFIFMGSTLSNMIDRHRALANIRDSMTEGDLLWVEISLYNNAQELINFYSNLEINSSEYFNKFKTFLSPLESFGMKNWMDFGKVIVQLSKDNDFLEYNFQIEKPFILEIPKTGKTKKIVQLKYQKGDKIVLNILKNYHENRLITEFREAKLKVKLLTTSSDYRSALVLVSV